MVLGYIPTFFVGGINNDAPVDSTGPKINAFLMTGIPFRDVVNRISSLLPTYSMNRE